MKSLPKKTLDFGVKSSWDPRSSHGSFFFFFIIVQVCSTQDLKGVWGEISQGRHVAWIPVLFTVLFINSIVIIYKRNLNFCTSIFMFEKKRQLSNAFFLQITVLIRFLFSMQLNKWHCSCSWKFECIYFPPKGNF